MLPRTRTWYKGSRELKQRIMFYIMLLTKDLKLSMSMRICLP